MTLCCLYIAYKSLLWDHYSTEMSKQIEMIRESITGKICWQRLCVVYCLFVCGQQKQTKKQLETDNCLTTIHRFIWAIFLLKWNQRNTNVVLRHVQQYRQPTLSHQRLHTTSTALLNNALTYTQKYWCRPIQHARYDDDANHTNSESRQNKWQIQLYTHTLAQLHDINSSY